jgi:hypothetical protein
MAIPRVMAAEVIHVVVVWAANAKAFIAAEPMTVPHIAGRAQRAICLRILSPMAASCEASSATKPRSMPTAMASHAGAPVTSSMPWARWFKRHADAADKDVGAGLAAQRLEALTVLSLGTGRGGLSPRRRNRSKDGISLGHFLLHWMSRVRPVSVFAAPMRAAALIAVHAARKRHALRSGRPRPSFAEDAVDDLIDACAR